MLRRRRSARRARGRGPPGHGPGPPLLPGRRQPAPGGSRRAPRAHARELRGLLGPVGRTVGVPGPAQGPSRWPATASSGLRFHETAQRWLWSHPFSADDLRSLRAMKHRAEELVVRRGLDEREIKRGPGGIRDIEFTVQLLQLVHGHADADLRSPNTLAGPRSEMAEAGYVDPDDADQLVGGPPLPAHRRAPTPAGGRAAGPHRSRRAGGGRPPGPGPRLSRHRRTATRPRRCGATCAASSSRCGRSTSACTSDRCSRRSPPPTARSARRPRWPGWWPSGSPMPAGPRPRCAS